MDIKFRELKIGEEFEVYGDVHINYDFPKICKCTKYNKSTGKEIEGIYFSMDEEDIVFKENVQD